MQRKHELGNDPLKTDASSTNVTAQARYIDLKFHAAGGLGEVFKATDEDLRRDVAIKFIQQRYANNAEYLELFSLESEITSRLDHPGVVPVYGIGQSADKRPFYTMRFIEGVPLREAIDAFHKSGSPARELHRLLHHLVAVCNTVAYAHNRGVVHCDIKPENIMLGRFGETLVVDWGLATTVERDDRARASGEKTMHVKSGSSSGKSSGGAAGTVGYMSPEQHPGFMRPIRPASDIYSLGATLYCLLTNQAPLQGAEETLLLDKLRYGEFPPPGKVNPHTPRALEAICMKAMAAHPADRYPTALEMATDLEAWLADEPVSVYQETLPERLLRWSRQHRTGMLSAIAATLLVLLIAFGAAAMLGRTATREKRARAEAEQASQAAEAARKRAVEAQHSGMRLAARFAAQAVASEIDRRWRILTEEAQNPELQRLMMAVEDKKSDSPQQKELQRWLEGRKQAQAPDADSWFLTDEHGVQIARDPLNRESLFVNFANRSYFSGVKAPGAEKTDKLPPISRPTLSTVYLSTASRTLKVAFSVPVWQDNLVDGTFLGVLGMSVELGEFSELQTGLDAGQLAVLVDTREDHTEGHPAQGLILHHPYLHQAEARREAAGDKTMFRIPAALVSRLERLRDLRARDAAAVADSLEHNYRDPVSDTQSGDVMAAFAPVRIETRPAEIRDTGWVVIVQETPVSGQLPE